jgi:hypothetical protein
LFGANPAGAFARNGERSVAVAAQACAAGRPPRVAQALDYSDGTGLGGIAANLNQILIARIFRKYALD